MRISGANVTRQLLWDATILTAVPVALVVLHATLPLGVKEEFYLKYHAPTPLNAFTSGFLHRSWGHLQRNIEAYTFVIPAVYAIHWKWQRRKSFWIVFFTILAFTPLVSAGFDYSVLHISLGRYGTTIGFSGIVNAYVGMLLASSGFYVAHRTSRWTGIGLVFIMYLMGSWVILDNLGGLTLYRIIVLLSGMILGAYLAIKEFDFEDFSEVRDPLKSHASDVGLISYAIIVFAASIAAGFPPDAGETGVNILAHMVGIVFGFLVVAMVWWHRGKSRIPWFGLF